MARWGRSFFHKFKEKIKEHKAKLEDLVDSENADDIQKYLSEKDQLNILLLQEETYWKQRAKLFWLREGDDNTRFFHASASAKKKANKIAFLTNDEGEKIENHDGICEVVRDYFTDFLLRKMTLTVCLLLTVIECFLQIKIED